MNYMKSFRSLLAASLIIGLLVPSATEPMQRHRSTWPQAMRHRSTWPEAIMITGTIFCLIYVWKDYTYRRDCSAMRQAICDLERDVNSMNNKYKQQVQFFNEVSKLSLSSFDEKVLEALSNEGVDNALISSFNAAYKNLQNSSASLQDRITRMTLNKTTREQNELIVSAKSAIERAQKIVDQFESCATYCLHHKAYFALYSAEQTARGKYTRAIDVRLQWPVLRSIILGSSSSKELYPCVVYAQNLEHVVNNMRQCLHNASYASNSLLMARARILYDNLVALKGIIVATQEYKQEEHEREMARVREERARLERERQRMEEERRRMERERIERERQHALAMQQAHQRELAAQREQEKQRERERERERQAALEREKAQREAAHAAHIAQMQNAHAPSIQVPTYVPHTPTPSAPPMEEAANYHSPAVQHNHVPTPSAPPLEQDKVYTSAECCTCLESFSGNVERIYLKPCGHDICTGCALDWFFPNNNMPDRSRTCPTCRGAVNFDQLVRDLHLLG